jgi:hypothetical protein
MQTTTFITDRLPQAVPAMSTANLVVLSVAVPILILVIGAVALAWRSMSLPEGTQSHVRQMLDQFIELVDRLLRALRPSKKPDAVEDPKTTPQLKSEPTAGLPAGGTDPLPDGEADQLPRDEPDPVPVDQAG